MLSHETWACIFEGNSVNTILILFLIHFCSRFPMIKVNKLLNHNSWIMSGIRTSCQHKRLLYLKLRNNNNSALMKYFKDYCSILSKVIKEAKRMEYDRHILNSNNVMWTSWILINRELGKDCKNYRFQSLNINGREYYKSSNYCKYR